MGFAVSYDSKICIHSANCVKTLPKVFRVENGRFIIDTKAATEDEIRKVVAACPSGALKIRD